MDPLEKTFGSEEEKIILGKDIKYTAGQDVRVCLKQIDQKGVVIEILDGKILSYEGKERYIPPGCNFVRIVGRKTIRGITTSSDREIRHRYRVKLSNGNIREFGQSDIYSEDASRDYIFKNAFLNK